MESPDHATDLQGQTNLQGQIIATKEIIGARVYNTALEELGFIKDLMIDNATGRIVYAVLKFGSHLGIGGHHYSVPWEKFDYNTELQAYMIDWNVLHNRTDLHLFL
jgi:sporulation protein YlmC with PRC-barrel domain